MTITLDKIQPLTCPHTSTAFQEQVEVCAARGLPFAVLKVDTISENYTSNDSEYVHGEMISAVLKTAQYKSIALLLFDAAKRATPPVRARSVFQITSLEPVTEIKRKERLIETLAGACLSTSKELRLLNQIELVTHYTETNRPELANFWCAIVRRYFEATLPQHLWNYSMLIVRTEEAASLLYERKLKSAIDLLQVSAMLKMNHNPALLQGDQLAQLQQLDPSSCFTKMLVARKELVDGKIELGRGKHYQELEKLLNHDINNSALWQLLSMFNLPKTIEKAKTYLDSGINHPVVRGYYGSMLLSFGTTMQVQAMGYKYVSEAARITHDPYLYAWLGMIDASQTLYTAQPFILSNVYKALYLDQDNYLANKTLGLAYMQGTSLLEPQPQSGVLFLLRALKSNPADLEILLPLLYFYQAELTNGTLSQDMYDNAQQCLQLALEHHPENQEILLLQLAFLPTQEWRDDQEINLN